MDNLIVLLILICISSVISVIIVISLFVCTSKDTDVENIVDDFTPTGTDNINNDITETPVISKRRSRRKKPWYERKKVRTNYRRERGMIGGHKSSATKAKYLNACN